MVVAAIRAVRRGGAEVSVLDFENALKAFFEGRGASISLQGECICVRMCVLYVCTVCLNVCVCTVCAVCVNVCTVCTACTVCVNVCVLYVNDVCVYA